jgi:hypothetical protein
MRTKHPDAEPGPGAGTRVDRGRCEENGVVGCMEGRPEAGAPIGNKKAVRHGRYTAEAITWRRGLAELIRQVPRHRGRAGRRGIAIQLWGARTPSGWASCVLVLRRMGLFLGFSRAPTPLLDASRQIGQSGLDAARTRAKGVAPNRASRDAA